jgi:hypothetical protein
MKNQLKTLDINAREWFDRVNGNSYFSAQIVIDFGLDTEKRVFIPFSYGYGDFYLWEALNTLKKENILSESVSALYQLQDAGVIIRYNKQKTLKRELKQENY